MNHLFESVAYLKGLAEGMDIKEKSKEGKLLLGILDTLEEIVASMEDLQEEQDDLAEYVEALDDDLAEVEESIMDDEDFEDDMDEEDIEFMEIECPKCAEVIYLDEDILYDDDAEILCPSCHELIEFDLSDFTEEEGGCCCGHVGCTDVEEEVKEEEETEE